MRRGVGQEGIKWRRGSQDDGQIARGGDRAGGGGKKRRGRVKETEGMGTREGERKRAIERTHRRKRRAPSSLSISLSLCVRACVCVYVCLFMWMDNLCALCAVGVARQTGEKLGGYLASLSRTLGGGSSVPKCLRILHTDKFQHIASHDGLPRARKPLTADVCTPWCSPPVSRQFSSKNAAIKVPKGQRGGSYAGIGNGPHGICNGLRVACASPPSLMALTLPPAST
jgi:hypothetical protein